MATKTYGTVSPERQKAMSGFEQRQLGGEAARRHICSARGTGIFAAETEAENAPSARSGDLETSSAH